MFLILGIMNNAINTIAIVVHPPGIAFAMLLLITIIVVPPIKNDTANIITPVIVDAGSGIIIITHPTIIPIKLIINNPKSNPKIPLLLPMLLISEKANAAATINTRMLSLIIFFIFIFF